MYFVYLVLNEKIKCALVAKKRSPELSKRVLEQFSCALMEVQDMAMLAVEEPTCHNEICRLGALIFSTILA